MIIYDYKVGDFMTKKVEAISENETVFNTAKIMTSKKIGSVVVMKKNEPIGIITDTDLVRKVIAKYKDPKKTKVKEVMTKNVITITKDDSIRRASVLMSENKIRRLPVIDKDKGLIGIVTETDLTRIISNLNPNFMR